MAHKIKPEEANADPEVIDILLVLNSGSNEELGKLARLLGGSRPIPAYVWDLVMATLCPSGLAKWRFIRTRRSTGRPSTGSEKFPSGLIARLCDRAVVKRGDLHKLAAMIDPHGDSEWTLRLEKRKGRQRLGMEETAISAIARSKPISDYVEALVLQGWSRKKAYKRAAADLKMSERSVRDAMSVIWGYKTRRKPRRAAKAL